MYQVSNSSISPYTYFLASIAVSLACDILRSQSIAFISSIDRRIPTLGRPLGSLTKRGSQLPRTMSSQQQSQASRAVCLDRFCISTCIRYRPRDALTSQDSTFRAPCAPIKTSPVRPLATRKEHMQSLLQLIKYACSHTLHHAQNVRWTIPFSTCGIAVVKWEVAACTEHTRGIIATLAGRDVLLASQWPGHPRKRLDECWCGHVFGDCLIVRFYSKLIKH